jgi:hypothetical protein
MARSLAERQITRMNLEEKINDSEVKGTSFFSKNLKNDKNFNKLIHSLRNVPEAQSIAQDMRIVFPDLINPITPRTAAGFAKAGMNQDRNSKKAFIDSLKEKISFGKNEKSAIDLITKPGWEKRLSELNSTDPSAARNLAAKLAQLLGRSYGSYQGAKSSEDKY